ncbi:unnamed protein product [Hermetia illucens]|uniref:PDZ domain-containing protein n=1 Tax=Hermetia illucens TaxID=343691 RepID=A0A7R8V8T7_HERIL|nr:Na(+)/H(+) exchange regulatory cofactor NHE-RF1 [Hermetia illucens]XP_037925565.1 Na(+)/H(+) exchange regulatory cofactor NHE-RF1 [Hermetia illucens]XP_037925566.1 Na(+)/H(+) exchange regulatory cofactor NHE-RF1 [Hermetia illucens]CAD7094228.1 unnamed protein product [Hermetia illucens]
MSKTENDQDSQVILEQKLSQEHRLCHMVKRPDFDGYGFNLHSEKGKPGQYIGKVDEKSPAEHSGLRQGDRIIEVNGVNIGSESHKQVVQRIKAIENEVRLLVIDPEVEVRLKQQHQKDQEASLKQGSTAQNNNNNSKNSSPTSSLKMQQMNNNRTSISTASSMESSSNGQDTATLTATPSPSPPPKQSDSSSTHNGTSNTSNGTTKMSNSSTEAGSTSSSTSGGLNLKMTAAEMRAKLQARKKYDPKNDSVDLRKKFDIIQKL